MEPLSPRHRDAARVPGLQRLVQRRRGLPNGRAVVGALLLTMAGVGTFAAANHRSDSSAVRYVTVARAGAPGARIQVADLEVRPLSLDPVVADNAFTDPTRLIGAVALAPLGAGQLVQRAEVATVPTVDGRALPPGHELTIPVPTDRMPTGLRRGERVAVLATYGSGSDARTVTTVQHALVVAVDAAGDTLATRGSARLTLALEHPEEVVETAHAAQVADLTVVRTTLANSDLPATFSVATPNTKPLVATKATG